MKRLSTKEKIIIYIMVIVLLLLLLRLVWTRLNLGGDSYKITELI